LFTARGSNEHAALQSAMPTWKLSDEILLLPWFILASGNDYPFVCPKMTKKCEGYIGYMSVGLSIVCSSATLCLQMNRNWWNLLSCSTLLEDVHEGEKYTHKIWL